jgi:hypothetical protein
MYVAVDLMAINIESQVHRHLKHVSEIGIMPEIFFRRYFKYGACAKCLNLQVLSRKAVLE